MCMSAIYWSRISRVYYSTDQEAAAAGFDDRLLYAELQKPVSKRQISMTQIIPHEGQRTFEIWQDRMLNAVQTQLSAGVTGSGG